ncbi:MAG: hypothetical protein WHF31_15325 [Candidatus Dehalobacter alkaniphilus]
MKAILIYTFILNGKSEVIRMCVDEKGRLSSWLYIPEITDKTKRWARMNKKQMNQHLKMFTDELKKQYSISTEEDEDDNQLTLDL